MRSFWLAGRSKIYSVLAAPIVVIAVGAIILMLPVSPARADVRATEYLLHFTGTGSEDVTDEAPSHDDLQSHQTADWTLAPADVKVWLPRYDSAPGSAAAGTKDYSAPDSRLSANGGEPTIGQVKESGTYTYQDDAGVSHTDSYTCGPAPVGYSGDYTHHVIVSPTDPSIELETDLSVLDVVPASSSFGPCTADPYYGPSDGYFLYAFDQPKGQRLTLGMLIPFQEIGDAVIGGPAQDLNNVQAEHSSLACYFSGNCTVNFSLAGNYSLKKVCDGVITSGGAASCAGGTGSTPPSNSSPNGSSPGGPPGSPSRGNPRGSPQPSSNPSGAPPPPGQPRVSPPVVTPCAQQQLVVLASACGATISIASAGGLIGIEIQQVVACRKTGHNPKGARGGRCVRYVTVFTGKRRSSGGRLRLRFTGDQRRRQLPEGSYRVVVWRIDASGRAGARRSASFRLG